MKSIYFLLPFFGSALALAQYPSTNSCAAACPKADCNTYNAAERCQCQNERETACQKKCSDYKPMYKPCPASPPPVECKCEEVLCTQLFPESCYCANAAKTECYKKCGGAKPDYETCPPRRTTLTLTRTRYPAATPKPTPTPTTPGPKPTNPICGGGRAGATVDCAEGSICIPNPFVPGACGPACDQLGICAENKLCGGFGGLKCDDPVMVCVDNPIDQCDPTSGGADCGGVCVYPEEIPKGYK